MFIKSRNRFKREPRKIQKAICLGNRRKYRDNPADLLIWQEGTAFGKDETSLL